MLVSAEIQVRTLGNGALIFFLGFKCHKDKMGTMRKNEIFKGSSVIPRQSTKRKYALYFKTSKQLGTLKE